VNQLASRKARLADHTGLDEEDMTIVNVHTLLAVTHASDPDAAVRRDMFRELSGLDFETVMVEFEDPATNEPLRSSIYHMLGVMRLYTKRPGKPADHDSPFTLPIGGTVEELAELVHRDLAETLKHARVWGSIGEGLTVGREHVLADGDVVELHG
jgi:ribosome-interacting GTPase 1